MKTTALTCQHCAAPLPDLPPSVRQIRCTPCGSPLHIERHGARARTEVVAERVRELEGRQIAHRSRLRRRAPEGGWFDGDEAATEVLGVMVGLPAAAWMVAVVEGETWLFLVAAAVTALLWGGFLWKSRHDDRRRERLRLHRRARRIHDAGERPADRT